MILKNFVDQTKHLRTSFWALGNQTDEQTMKLSVSFSPNSLTRVWMKLLQCQLVSQIFLYYLLSFILSFPPSVSPQWKTDIVESKPLISMVTAVPACIVSEPTRQAADSGTKSLRRSFGRKKNFTDSGAKLQRRFPQKSRRDAAARAWDMNNKTNLCPLNKEHKTTRNEINHITSRFCSALRVKTTETTAELQPAEAAAATVATLTKNCLISVKKQKNIK